MEFATKSVWSLGLLCLLFSAPTVVGAQPVATGHLTGVVVDAQGGVVPGALIAATHQQTGAEVETVTGGDGRFTLPVRPGGPYRVTATIIGFSVQEKRDLFVAAGDRQRLDFEVRLASVDETVVVTAGTALARDEKRIARSITDIVSADSVGRFPDANAAEALRRVPGVSMEIDQGEGRFVVVRGIDASLNNVTLNGQIIGTPAEFGTRGVSMDAVPADLISKLEVVKAVRPDMDANAIGASIDISTLGAFDQPAGFLLGSLRTGYNPLSGRAPYSGSATYGRPFGGGRWGFVAGGSYSRRRYESELYRIADGAWRQQNGFFVPQNQAHFLYDINRRRQGVNTSLEFRPSTGNALALRFNHNRFEDTEGRQQTSFDFTRGTLSSQTPTSGQFSAGRASKQYRDYNQQHLINALQLGGDHAVRATTVDWKLGASRGQRRTPYRVDWEFQSGANAFPNSYDVSNPVLPVITPSENYYDPTAYPFRRVRFRSDIEREDVLTGEINVRRSTTAMERPIYWKAGAKAVHRDKTQDRTNDNYNTASPAFTFNDFGLAEGGPGNFFRNNLRFGPTIALPTLQAFFAANPNRFVFDPTSTLQNSLEQDFDAGEDVYAGYVMGGIDFAKWNLMAGVRVENTRGDYSANELLFANGAFTGRTNPATGTTNYTDVLPGVHVNYFPTQKLTIRMAFTNTLGRPAYADLAPISVLDDLANADGTFTGSLSTGNSELKPYQSMNLDLSFEFYLRSGLISVAPFYKKIDNAIYDRSFFETNVVRNGRRYERLAFSRPENADGGHIAGLELNYQNTFSALPSPFDGLGTNLNYTFTDSAVRIAGRDEPLPFFGQSDHIGNVALLFEKYGATAQVSMSFNSPSLGAVGLTADADNYGDRYAPIDAKISFPVTTALRGFVEFRNINDQDRLRYSGTRERRTAHELYGRDFYAGIDWRF